MLAQRKTDVMPMAFIGISIILNLIQVGIEFICASFIILI